MNTQVNLNLLSKIIPRFREFLRTEGKKWDEERKKKDKFFLKYFSKENLPHLKETTLRQLIHVLWAFYGWTNKEYLLQEMLRTGLDKIRSAFGILLYSDEPISKRFDHVRLNVRMMGAASISEILAHHDHTKYPLWNGTSKEGLIFLGISDSVFPKSSQISGNQYQAFSELLSEVHQQIVTQYPEFGDLFILDFLLFYISVMTL